MTEALYIYCNVCARYNGTARRHFPLFVLNKFYLLFSRPYIIVLFVSICVYQVFLGLSDFYHIIYAQVQLDTVKRPFRNHFDPLHLRPKFRLRIIIILDIYMQPNKIRNCQKKVIQYCCYSLSSTPRNHKRLSEGLFSRNYVLLRTDTCYQRIRSKYCHPLTTLLTTPYLYAFEFILCRCRQNHEDHTHTLWRAYQGGGCAYNSSNLFHQSFVKHCGLLAWIKYSINYK